MLREKIILIEVSPYELKLILAALHFSEYYYDGEESITDMSILRCHLEDKYGHGNDEGSTKYTDAEDV